MRILVRFYVCFPSSIAREKKKVKTSKFCWICHLPAFFGLTCDLNVCFWFVTQRNFIYRMQKKNGIVNFCNEPHFLQTTPYWRWDMIWDWMFLHYTYCSVRSNGKILVIIIFIARIYTIYNWNICLFYKGPMLSSTPVQASSTPADAENINMSVVSTGVDNLRWAITAVRFVNIAVLWLQGGFRLFFYTTGTCKKLRITGVPVCSGWVA